MDDRPIWTPDTSGINRLADDPDSDALIAGLRSGFFVRLTFTSIGEVIANEDADRRRKLLRICGLLLSAGDCIDPQHEILRKMVAEFEATPSFDWRKVRVDFPEAQVEIARRENFSDEEARQEREENEKLKDQFARVYEDAKPHFDRLFSSGAENPPRNVAELVARLQIPGGAFWTLAGNIYARVGKKSPDEALMRKFVAACDPFRALMVAFIAAQYDLCLRPERVGPSFRSGRNDTLMAICLPYCHQFVTNDKGQLACYRAVASVADLDVAVRSYEDFRNGFSVIGAAAG
ncbi:MAG TPA: hypothetical protein VOA88_16705 [Candidatus Dormibacteraeota bacterium]|nr:hypothetical protein [Candidatus Dormibacteraeota bacterium]